MFIPSTAPSTRVGASVNATFVGGVLSVAIVCSTPPAGAVPQPIAIWSSALAVF